MNLPANCIRVFDGMVLIQQLVSTKLTTFDEMSEYLLKRIASSQAKIICLVTDEYNEDSLKGIERQRRAAAGSIRMQIIRREQKRPKQFKKYLGDCVNKVDFVRFLLKDWSHPERFKNIITGRVLSVTVESKCYGLEVSENAVTCRPEDALNSDQEEADTKMFPCCQHATQ